MTPAEEWETWTRIAWLSFVLRFPAQLAAFPKGTSEAKPDRDRFLRYGWELEATERDLSECVNELSLAETLHRGSLALKKFAVVYHTDNFNVRVHKIRENAFTLVALAVGLEPDNRRAGPAIPLIEQIRRGLTKRPIKGFLQATKDFDTNRVVNTAISARHAFVHRYRDEPAKGLAARERYAWLPEPKDDPLAEAVRVLNEKSVDLYIEQQAAHLTALIEPIRVLRRHLFEASVREVLVLAGRRLPRSRFEELKAFIDPFTDLV